MTQSGPPSCNFFVPSVTTPVVAVIAPAIALYGEQHVPVWGTYSHVLPELEGKLLPS